MRLDALGHSIFLVVTVIIFDEATSWDDEAYAKLFSGARCKYCYEANCNGKRCIAAYRTGLRVALDYHERQFNYCKTMAAKESSKSPRPMLIPMLQEWVLRQIVHHEAYLDIHDMLHRDRGPDHGWL